MKKILTARSFLIFVLAVFVIMSVYLVVLMSLPEARDSLNFLVRSDHNFLLLYCISAIAGLFVPHIIKKWWGFAISGTMSVIYTGFIFAALFLGTLMNFYDIFPFWDDMLHFFSGITLAILGFAILDIMQKQTPQRISAVGVAIFALCFAMALGKLWEIYEFLIDYFLGTNTQRFMDSDGVPFVGQEALMDTMIDMIFNTAGAIIASIWGYRRLKGKGWPKGLSIVKV